MLKPKVDTNSDGSHTFLWNGRSWLNDFNHGGRAAVRWQVSASTDEQGYRSWCSCNLYISDCNEEIVLCFCIHSEERMQQTRRKIARLKHEIETFEEALESAHKIHQSMPKREEKPSQKVTKASVPAADRSPWAWFHWPWW
jgi:hypothetical protein